MKTYLVKIHSSKKIIEIGSYNTLEKAKQKMIRTTKILNKMNKNKIWGTVTLVETKKTCILDSDFSRLRLKTKKGKLLES